MASSSKFDRKYELTIYIEGFSPLVIKLPFTIQFDITRNTLSSSNACQLRIYNLSSVNRNQIRLDPFSYVQYIRVDLKAGYGDNLATIFDGNMSQSWSVREGTNFISQLECFDAGFSYVNAKTNIPVTSGLIKREVIIQLIKSLPGVSLGNVGDYPGTFPRGNSLSGNTIDLLNELTGNGFFIDNGKGYALGTNEVIEPVSSELLIDASTGLLGTPILEKQKMHLEMLFEPNLNVGQLVNVQSSTVNNYNGVFKVTGVKHRGMISGAVCGSVTTIAEVFNTKPLKKVPAEAI